MLSPKLDHLMCVLGLKVDKFGMVTSPNLAAAQNAIDLPPFAMTFD